MQRATMVFAPRTPCQDGADGEKKRVPHRRKAVDDGGAAEGAPKAKEAKPLSPVSSAMTAIPLEVCACVCVR